MRRLYWLAAALAVPTGLFALLLVPQVEDVFAKAVYTYLGGRLQSLFGLAILSRTVVYCVGDWLGCVKQEFNKDLVNVYKWNPGVGKLVWVSPSLIWTGHAPVPVFFSHAAYRSWAHDPKAGRPPDFLVFHAKKDLPDGVLPDGEPTVLLNFDTGTAEHTARRRLLADTLPQLEFNPKRKLAIKVPPKYASKPVDLGAVRISSELFKHIIFDVVGYNLFLELFNVDVNDELAELFEYDGIFAPGVLGVPILRHQAKRLASIRGKVMAKVRAGPVAKKFQAAARSRGMDPDKRLNELVWIAMFAGYGGTGNLVMETMKQIVRDTAKYIPLFRRDPRAFMLEAARVHPPVGGMNPVAARQPLSIRMGNGVMLEMKPGDMALLHNTGANNDPSVFEEPERFIPGRANATRLLSWNNEVGAFSTCESVAGCPAAPRGCPGTWLALRLSTAAVDYFVQGLEAKGRGPSEAPRAQEL